MATVPLRRNREFMLLWVGQAVSSIGSQASAVAYPLLVLAVTGSPAKAGVVGFAATIPTALLALPAGALADRVNRKYLMVSTDGVRAAALASIPVALALGSVPYALIVAVAFIDGAGYTFTYVCERGVLRLLVPAEQLGEAVARNESRMFGALLAGPPLGGLLFGIGRAIPFAADAVTYAASSTSKLMIRSDFQEQRSELTPGHTLEGLRWIWRRPFVRFCSLLFACSNPVLSGLMLLVVVLAKHHGASPELVGVMLGIGAGGGVIGAALAPRLQRRLTPRAVLASENWAFVVAIALLLVVHNALLIGLLLALALIITPVSNSIVVSARVALAPDRLQGRVQAASTLISFSTTWTGPLFVGFMVQHAGSSATILALAGWCVVLAIGATRSRALREGPPLSDGPTVS